MHQCPFFLCFEIRGFAVRVSARNTLHRTTLGYKDRGSILNHVREQRQKWAFSVVRNMLHFCAFRALSFPYLRSVYHPRYETIEIPRNWTEKAAQVSWSCRPVMRPFLVNEQHAAKPSGPTNNEQKCCLNHVRGSRPKHEHRNLSTIYQKSLLLAFQHESDIKKSIQLFSLMMFYLQYTVLLLFGTFEGCRLANTWIMFFPPPLSLSLSLSLSSCCSFLYPERDKFRLSAKNWEDDPWREQLTACTSRHHVSRYVAVKSVSSYRVYLLHDFIISVNGDWF